MISRRLIVPLVTAATLTVYALSAGQGVVKQMTGPLNTNCYLLIDDDSREAAIVDAGGPLDSLSAVIQRQSLKVKYLLITHCHPDHLEGLQALVRLYPDARLAVSKSEYDNFNGYARWSETFAPALVASWKKRPRLIELMDFDYQSVGEADIVLADNMGLMLGQSEIRVYLTPGHTQGSVSFAFHDVVCVGDLLLYHGDGFLESDFSDQEALNRAVARLYEELPESTRILSGHGPSSTIAVEMRQNRKHKVK